MNSSEMIEKLIELSYRKYKKLSKGCVECSRLDRKEETVIDGITFTCWNEYVCYRVCEYIKSKVPGTTVRLNLDGNNSSIEVEMDDCEERELNAKMYQLIKEWKE